MDTTKINAFLLIAQHKSFSKVAKEFAYTPSALSHMADALEKELGVILFKRTHYGVELTDAGKQLYDKFVAVVEAENVLMKAAYEVAREQEAVLRIGTYSSIARHLLPEILHDFKKDYPAVKTTIVVEDNIRQQLKNDTLDIIFTDEYHRAEATEWCPIMEDRYVVAVPETLFADKTAVSREELYAHPFIRLDEQVLDTYFNYGAFREIIHIQSIENETAVSMVKGNIGVAVVPSLNMKTCPAGVRVLELTPNLSRTIGVQYKRRNASLATERFVKHLKEKYRSI